MRRSVSARIFAGFLLLMVAFGTVMGFSAYRMQQVSRQLELISGCYLRLTLILGEVFTVQRNLLNTVAERTPRVSRFVRRQVRLARQFRLHEVEIATKLVTETVQGDLPSAEGQDLERVARLLGVIMRTFSRNEALFERVFGEGGDAASTKLRESLQARERKLAATIRGLRNDLRAQVRSAARDVEQDQRHGLWAGLALVVLALLVGLAVTVQARRTLRPLRSLVEGTKRIGSGDYGERVPVLSGDELGQLAGEFNKMAEAIEEREQRLIQSERMAAAGMLASHITHEVRNPLNSISLNTEMLEEELVASATTVTDEARSLCRAIRAEVDRLTSTTEEYLRFARPPKPALQPEDINEILASLVAFVGEEFRARGVSCEVELAADLPAVLADENQLRQAFLNLLRNAGEALGDGGGAVTLKTSRSGGYVQVQLRDTGPGIDPNQLKEVFEPFFTTKERGTGLGLALTQRIVQEHGGRISAESEVGRGAVFTVLLPASRVQDKLVV